MTLALIAVPLLAGLLAFLLRSDRPRRSLLVGAALLHALLSAACWVERPEPAWGGWLGVDELGLLFLSLASLLFLAASVYALGYLESEQAGARLDFEEGRIFSNAPEARFVGCLLLFLAAMTTACLSRHFGLFWVATEATTLASAPLIFFHRHHRSLEATWKYLLLCSVGIALALLGNSFLAVAAPDSALELGALLARAARAGAGGGAGPGGPASGPGGLELHWLRAAFLLFLVGYGTKMGLAPLHSWLPDAHSESPSLVSALLSGALLNCSFLGLLRLLQVLAAAGQAGFARELLVLFGLLSMAVAAVFIQGQPDYKRMLAYSSVEHMGILALGVGLGAAGSFGALLHAVNHSLLKAMLFLVSGNILAAYRTKSTSDVRGASRLLPVSGALWVAGFLALTGAPPFGAFLSEFTVLKAAVDQGRFAIAAAYLACLAAVFVGMSTLCLRMAQGPAPGEAKPEPWVLIGPPLAFAAGSLLLGLHVPRPLLEALSAAARAVG